MWSINLSVGGFDGDGTLWVAVPTEGTVVALTPGRAGAGPKVLRTVTVAPPGHDLVCPALDEGVAVLDNTDQVLARSRREGLLHRDPGRQAGQRCPLAAAEPRPGHRPRRPSGRCRRRGGKVVQFTVPGTGPLAPAVAFAGHVYCADPAAGIVYEFDAAGKLVNQIHIAAAGGPLELEVREDHLFINAPDGSTARVVDKNHVVNEVNKYEHGVLGGDPPPPPQPKPDAEAGQDGARQAPERHRLGRRRDGPGHLAPGPRQRRADHQVRGHRRRADHHGRRQPALRADPQGLTNGKTYTVQSARRERPRRRARRDQHAAGHADRRRAGPRRPR